MPFAATDRSPTRAPRAWCRSCSSISCRISPSRRDAWSASGTICRYADVVAKGKAIGKAVRLIGQLDASLNMEQGGQIAENLRNLYLYMLGRLTTANLHNDAQIAIEVSNLVRKIKTGWDQIVKDER